MKFKKEQKPGEKSGPMSPMSTVSSIVDKQSPKLSPADYQEDLQTFSNYQEVAGGEVCQNSEKLKNDFDKAVVGGESIALGQEVRSKKVRSDESTPFYETNLNYFNGFDGFYVQSDMSLHTSTTKLGESNHDKTWGRQRRLCPCPASHSLPSYFVQLLSLRFFSPFNPRIVDQLVIIFFIKFRSRT